jgi:hypothetical protein
MVLTDLEEVLVRWKRNYDYLEGERIYGPQLLDEQAALIKISGKAHPADEENEEDIIEHPLNAITEVEDTPDVSRLVYTPTGLVLYVCYLRKSRKLSSIRRVKNELNRQIARKKKGFVEALHFYHGHYIRGWKRRNLPLEERVKNHVVSISIAAEPESDIITARDHFSFRFNFDSSAFVESDPLYQYLKTMTGAGFGRRSNEASQGIDLTFRGYFATLAKLYPDSARVNAQGRPLTDSFIAKAQERSDGDDWLPKNRHAYQLLLETFSQFIERTAEEFE